jgi:hypothetical protein
LPEAERPFSPAVPLAALVTPRESSRPHAFELLAPATSPGSGLRSKMTMRVWATARPRTYARIRYVPDGRARPRTRPRKGTRLTPLRPLIRKRPATAQSGATRTSSKTTVPGAERTTVSVVFRTALRPDRAIHCRLGATRTTRTGGFAGRANPDPPDDAVPPPLPYEPPPDPPDEPEGDAPPPCWPPPPVAVGAGVAGIAGVVGTRGSEGTRGGGGWETRGSCGRVGS